MPMVGFGTLPRLLIAFDGKMMGTSQHADALAKLIGPNGGSLDEYIPLPVDSTQLTVDAVSGVTADLEEVVVFRYSMSLSRLALYDGPVTFRRFRTTPAGPELLSREERSVDEMAELRCSGRVRAQTRLADEYGEDWHREVKRMINVEQRCPGPHGQSPRAPGALRCPAGGDSFLSASEQR